MAGQFAATVERFRSQGGHGVNVTLPYKPDACAYATHLAESGQLAGEKGRDQGFHDRSLARR